uniref:Uncharacterized protein n=1 Tax=Rhizophora mucronata TaxID=61149 RepID=A0A2P2QNR5_RHIMU
MSEWWGNFPYEITFMFPQVTPGIKNI